MHATGRAKKMSRLLHHAPGLRKRGSSSSPDPRSEGLLLDPNSDSIWPRSPDTSLISSVADPYIVLCSEPFACQALALRDRGAAPRRVDRGPAHGCSSGAFAEARVSPAHGPADGWHQRWEWRAGTERGDDDLRSWHAGDARNSREPGSKIYPLRNRTTLPEGGRVHLSSSQGRGLGGVGPQGIGDGCACLGRARCNALGRSALGDDRGDRRLQGVGLGRARVDAEEHLGGRKHRFGRGRCMVPREGGGMDGDRHVTQVDDLSGLDMMATQGASLNAQ